MYVIDNQYIKKYIIMTRKELREKIKIVINILSKNQKDIKYIQKKYSNSYLLSEFDEINYKNKEVLRALFYIYRNIDECKNKVKVIYTKYIFNDVTYDFYRRNKQKQIDTFFFNLQRYYMYKIYLCESFISLRYDFNYYYGDVAELSYVMNLLLKKFPLYKESVANHKSFIQIDVEKFEKKYRIQYLREDKIKRLMK